MSLPHVYEASSFQECRTMFNTKVGMVSIPHGGEMYNEVLGSFLSEQSMTIRFQLLLDQI